MATITFDTLKFSKRLEEAGAAPELAEAIAEAQKESLSEVLETQLATKIDIEHVKYEIKLTRWMVGLSLALSLGIISLLVRLFFALPTP